MFFEEYLLTAQVEKIDTLPELIRVGSFNRSVDVPAMLPFAMANGLFFEIDERTKQTLQLQLEYIALTLLKKVNTDLINLLFVDVGVRTSFPNLHGLKLPNLKFISEQTNLKTELQNLYKTARNVNTKCFTNSINTLTKFNATTDYKEPYNILFIPNLPKDFKDDEMEILVTLTKEASDCGIYSFITFDKKYLPEETKYNQEKISKIIELKKCMIHLDFTTNPVKLNNFNIPFIQEQFSNYPFQFENYTENDINQVVTDLNKSIVSIYQQDKNFLSIPIGRSGREEIFFEMGSKADAYHCMIAGQTRTGKSTFLNLLITKIAELYTPQEVRLYLLDYKVGVEFNMYKNHPNVECLLLDNSNLEYAITILKKFENEFEKRGALFKEDNQNASNIQEYNENTNNKLPRLLLIIDEVQELFTRDFKIAKQINLILAKVAKQGGAFGIHLILCTQSYANCNMDNAIINQIKLRIAFRLSNGADCRAVFGRDNEAALKLQRYHIVYNADNGFEDKNVIVRIYNIDKKEINSFLQKKSIEYKNLIDFNKSIIVKGSSKDEIKIDEYGF